MIRLEHVTVAYEGTPVLKDLSLRVVPGSFHAVLGPGGSGKSVLLRLVCGLVAPQEGRVWVAGRALEELTPHAEEAFRRDIGVQFQGMALFDWLTVAENVAFPLVREGGQRPSEIEARVQSRLADVGLAAAAAQYPAALSGGMRRRVAIARATIADARLLLFDDPTGGLDPVSSARIFRLIDTIRRRTGATVVVVSHDVDRLASLCDRVSVLRDGALTFDGTFAELEVASEDGLDGFRPQTISEGGAP